MVHQFALKFFVNSITASILILLILIMKRMLHRKIGVKWQYKIDLICTGMFFIPFLPNRFFIYRSLFKIPRGIKNLHEAMASKVNDIYSGMSNIVTERSWMQDYSQSVNRTLSDTIYFIMLTIWVIGIIVFSTITILNNRNIKLLKNSMMKIKDDEIITIFTNCKKRAGVKPNIILGETPLIQSPMVTGLLKVYIILPSKCINRLSKQEIGYILLHELIHVKKMDILINYTMCLLRIIYWFNPCVYFFLKEMKSNREIACDASVLDILDRNSFIEYGKTIINFVEVISNTYPFYMTANMGGI